MDSINFSGKKTQSWSLLTNPGQPKLCGVGGKDQQGDSRAWKRSRVSRTMQEWFSGPMSSYPKGLCFTYEWAKPGEIKNQIHSLVCGYLWFENGSNRRKPNWSWQCKTDLLQLSEGSTRETQEGITYKGWFLSDVHSQVPTLNFRDLWGSQQSLLKSALPMIYLW